MAAKRRQPDTPRSISEAQPSGALLGLLTALGTGAALWALFQWGELLVVRLGGESFCSINETLDCRAVWDSALASAVHEATGVPVAGWGLCWGLVALALPLMCLVWRAEQKPLRGLPEAVVLTGVAGVATVVVMAIASLAAGKLCITCLATYVLVLAYAALAWRLWSQRGFPLPWPGLKFALGATLVIYLALLIPGLRTPHSSGQQGLEHLSSAPIVPSAPAPTAAVPSPPEQATQTPAAQAPPPAPAPQAKAPTAPAPPAKALTAPAPPPSEPVVPTPPPPVESYVLHGVNLGQFIESLPPEARQHLSDSLGIYRSASPVATHPPRALDGPENAPVLITDFTDALCSHCASLHKTINALKQKLPRELFAVDARHFPLDAGCNRTVPSPPRTPVRCLAAKAQICMEGRLGHGAFVDNIFERQRYLSEDLIYALASSSMSRKELDICASSSDTVRKLEEDIDWATSVGFEGTPLVLVNGKKGTPFAPFLYAIILTEGDGDHPVFANLPPPNSPAHPQ